MNILLTGAAGFVGWATSRKLLEGGHSVLGVDNLNDYYDVRLKKWRLEDLRSQFAEGFEFKQIDIERMDAVETLFRDRKFDAVINLAARAGVRASIADPHVYFRTNVNGTVHLLEAMRVHSVRKFVLASTSSLYAGTKPPFREDLAVNEPISPYAASKKGAEAAAYTWHHLYGIDVSVVRYFTVYGPAGRPDMSPLRFLKWMDRGEPIQLYGDGAQSRDFTYIEDIADGTVRALQPVGHAVFNLGGGGAPVSILSMIHQFEKLLGKKALIDYLPFNKADMKVTQADNRKAREILGWNPVVQPEEGFQLTVDWFRQHKNSYSI